MEQRKDVFCICFPNSLTDLLSSLFSVNLCCVPQCSDQNSLSTGVQDRSTVPRCSRELRIQEQPQDQAVYLEMPGSSNNYWKLLMETLPSLSPHPKFVFVTTCNGADGLPGRNSASVPCAMHNQNDTHWTFHQFLQDSLCCSNSYKKTPSIPSASSFSLRYHLVLNTEAICNT